MRLASDKARWMEDSEGTWLCLRTTRREAAQTVDAVKEGKRYSVEVKQWRERRSLDSNGYAWLLMGKLAAKLRMTPDEVYRSYIKDVADNYTIVPVKEGLVEHWDRIWCSGHLGRMTVDMGPCRNLKGYRNVMSYLGSSDYDKAQMARLIDLVVQDCKAQEIETATPEELARLEEEWGKRYA